MDKSESSLPESTLKKESAMIRTTIDLPRHLHIQAKMMAILTNKSVSYLMRSALSEKIKEIKEKNAVRSQ